MRWLLLSLALMIGIVQSQETAPSKQHGDPTAQGDRKKQIGTNERPLVITINSTEADKKEAERREKESRDKAESDWNLIYWTRVLAVLAGLQLLALTIHAFIFYSQARSSRLTIDQMRVSEQRQLRAYVHVTTPEFQHLAAGEMVTAVFKIKNFGQTPAYKLRHWAKIGVDTYPISGPVPFDPDDGTHPASLLPPNDALSSVASFAVFDVAPMNQATLDAFMAGTHALYLIGTIVYEDVFGKTHTTKFCLYAGGGLRLWNGTVANYRDGNEAD